jgi:hypothetical protein
LKRIRSTGLSVLLGATVASRAFAASEPDNPQAQSFFRVGAQAYDSGDYDSAILAFREAYAHAPRTGLLFSLGLSYRNRFFAAGNRDDLEQAIACFRDYLARAPQGGRHREAVDALSALVPLENPQATAAAPDEQRPDVRAHTLLMVSSLTPSIAIDVDGSRADHVPVVVEVTPGRHVVRGHAPGYRDEERRVDILAGSSLALNLDLSLLPSYLRVLAPPDTTVLVDRRFEGNPSTPLVLAAGRHEVVVLKRGFDTASRVVTLKPGEHRSVAITLDTSSQRRLAYVSFTLGAVAAVTAAVFGGLSWSEDAKASSLHDTAQTRNLTTAEFGSYNDAVAARNRFRVFTLVSASVAVTFGGVGLGLYALETPELSAAR